MQSIAQSITPDHLKLVLVFFFALLSLYKIHEIRIHNTQIKSSHQFDVNNKDRLKQEQSGVRDRNIPANSWDFNYNSTGDLVASRKVYTMENTCNRLFQPNRQCQQQMNANQEKIKQNSKENTNEKITFGQYLKRKQEEALFRLKDQPLMRYAKQFQQQIKRYHSMEAQDPVQSQVIEGNVRIINQSTKFYSSPKSETIKPFSFKCNEREYANSKKEEKSNISLNNFQTSKEEQDEKPKSKTIMKEQKLIKNKLRSHALNNGYHQNSINLINYRKAQLQRLSRNLLKKNTNTKAQK